MGCVDVELPLALDDSLVRAVEYLVIGADVDYPEVVGPGWWQISEACRYVWELENVAQDENGALELFQSESAAAGFDCERLDHDALQTFRCRRGNEALLIQNVGFVMAHILWEVPQE